MQQILFGRKLMNNDHLLRLESINTFYGLSHILFDVSMEVRKGETFCILGRNGAGKTTTIRSISGLTPASSGKVIFQNEDITQKKPHNIAKEGIYLVPLESPGILPPNNERVTIDDVDAAVI